MKRVIFTTLACIFTLGIGFAAERHTMQYAEKSGEKLLLDHYPAVGVEGCARASYLLSAEVSFVATAHIRTTLRISSR